MVYSEAAPLLRRTLADGEDLRKTALCQNDRLCHHLACSACVPLVTAPVAGSHAVVLCFSCCFLLSWQVLEEWQPAEWRRAMQPVARGVAAACGDSAADTRALGRAMCAAFELALFHMRSKSLIHLE